MTAADFCRSGISVKEPICAPIPPARSWLVRFRYSLRGEPPQIAQETVKNMHSEAGAIRAGISQRLGTVNRALHSLEMLEVRAL